jgi:hypothetical protein
MMSFNAVSASAANAKSKESKARGRQNERNSRPRSSARSKVSKEYETICDTLGILNTEELERFVSAPHSN